MARNITHVVTLDQFARYVGQLPGALEGAIIKGLRSAAMRGVAEVAEQINAVTPYPPIDTGELARSVAYSSLERGGRCGVDAPHAAVMEEGARPFTPPLAPLEAWARRKFSVDDQEAKRIARAVQGKIRRYGIAPRHYFRASMVMIRRYAVIEVERELKGL